MPDLLLFAESLFIWQLVNYALYPVCDDETPAERGKSSVRSGFSRLIDAGSRSLAAALLVLAADGFRRTGYLPAAIVFIGSLVLPAVRRRISAVSLAEFELVANARWLSCCGSCASTCMPAQCRSGYLASTPIGCLLSASVQRCLFTQFAAAVISCVAFSQKPAECFPRRP